MFQLARVAMEYSCFSRPAETILAKCARFLKIEITRNFGILKLLSKDDYEIFQVASLSMWQLRKIELVPFKFNIHICHISKCIKNACPAHRLIYCITLMTLLLFLRLCFFSQSDCLISALIHFEMNGSEVTI